MRHSELEELYAQAWPKGRKILVVGPAGMGKTVGKRNAARRLNYDFISLSGPLLSPVKVGGYPIAPKEAGGDASHAPFGGIARAFRATKPTILDFDDIGMCGGETSKSVIEFVQFGEIDGRRLPDHVVISGSTNDIGHGADVQGMIEPLKTRWDTIVKLEVNVEDMVSYGLAMNWPTDLCAFLRSCPEAIHDLKPSKSIAIDGACPRGWEHVADWINMGVDHPEVICGCVGKGRGTQYLAYRELINELPDPDAIILAPDTAIVPAKPDARYLVGMALSSKMTAQNFGAILKYLNRMPAMFRAASVRDAFKAEANRKHDGTLPKGWVQLCTNRDFMAWVASEDGKVVMSAAG